MGLAVFVPSIINGFIYFNVLAISMVILEVLAIQKNEWKNCIIDLNLTMMKLFYSKEQTMNTFLAMYHGIRTLIRLLDSTMYAQTWSSTGRSITDAINNVSIRAGR